MSFRIVLANPTNPTKPVSVLQKTVVTDENGTASASFSGLPLVSALGSIDISDGHLAGYTSFRGASDLESGENEITLVPRGCGHPKDMAAFVFEEATRYPELIASANHRLVAQIESILQSPGLQTSPTIDPTIFERLFLAFVEAVVAPTMSRFSVTNDRQKVAVFGAQLSIVWAKGPSDWWSSDQFWGISPIEMTLDRIIRQPRNGTGLIGWVHESTRCYSITRLVVDSGNCLGWVKNPGPFDLVFECADGSLIVGGYHYGRQCPIVFRWDGTGAAAVAGLNDSPTTGLAWVRFFDSLSTNASRAAILSLRELNGQIEAGVRDPSTSLIRYALLDPLTGKGDLPQNHAVAANIPPTASIERPTAHSRWLSSSGVAFDIQAHDSDGFIRWVELFARSASDTVVQIGIASASPFRILWNSPPRGEWEVFAQVTDNSFATARSNELSIQIIADPESSTIQLVEPMTTGLLNTLNLHIRIRPRPNEFNITAEIPCGTPAQQIVWGASPYVSDPDGLIIVSRTTDLMAVQPFLSLQLNIPLPWNSEIDFINRDTGMVVGRGVVGQ